MIIAIGTGNQAVDAIPELEAMLRQPPLTLERVQLCKRDGELMARPFALPAVDDHGRALWQKLMVYTSEATLHDGVPIHRAIVQRLFEANAGRGATALRGIWGYHGDHKPHGDNMIQLTRQVPVATIVVDNPERIAASFDIIDGVTDRRGLSPASWCPHSCRSMAASVWAEPRWPITTTDRRKVRLANFQWRSNAVEPSTPDAVSIASPKSSTRHECRYPPHHPRVTTCQ